MSSSNTTNISHATTAEPTLKRARPNYGKPPRLRTDSPRLQEPVPPTAPPTPVQTGPPPYPEIIDLTDESGSQSTPLQTREHAEHGSAASEATPKQSSPAKPRRACKNCYQQKIICDRVQPTCSNCAKRKNNKAIPCQWFPVTTKRTYKKEPRKRISKLDNELLAAQRRLAYEQYGELAFSLTETQLGVFILGRSPFPDAQMGVPVSNQVSDGRRLTPQGSLSPLSSESKGSSISRQTITSSQTPEQHLCTNCGSSSLIPVTPMITLPHTRSPPSMPFLPAQPQFADPGRTAKLSQAPNTMAPHSEIPGLPNEFSWVFDIHPELQEVSMDDTHAPSIGDFPSNNYDESNLEDILSYEPEPLDNLGTTLYGDFSEDMGAEQNGSLVEPLHDSPDAFGDSIGSAFTTDLNQVRSIESTNSPNYETDSTYYGEMNSATKQAGHTTGIENEQNENELLIEHLDSELFGPDSD